MRDHTTFERSQIVHDTVRVEQFRSCLGLLMSNTIDKINTLKLVTVDILIKDYLKHQNIFAQVHFRICPPEFIAIIDYWMKSSKNESLYGLTIRQVFTIIYNAVKDNGKEFVYLKRLKVELDEPCANSLCFTGRMLRLMNAAVGIIDGVHVGLSVLEHLNNQAILLSRSRKKKETNTEFKERLTRSMIKLLDDAKIADETTRNAYLQLEFYDNDKIAVEDSI